MGYVDTGKELADMAKKGLRLDGGKHSTSPYSKERVEKDIQKALYERSLKEEELEAKKKEGTADEITGTDGNADTTKQ